jgi:hypothetical protein
MKHFFTKNFKFLGAGGGPQKPDPPPPPVLKPPKLGDLQAVSSYEYTESIDLISDGVIDGFVNQRGEYVSDLQIFESVYLNDVPIRQATNIDATSVDETYDLSFISTGVTGLFYPSGFSSGFALVSPLNLTGISGTSPNGISYQFIYGRSNIAQNINLTINSIPNLSSQNDAYSIQFSNLKAKFNYGRSTNLIKNYLLPSLPSLTDNDYPFFALKLNFAVQITTGSNFNYSLDSFVKINNDISNYAYLPLEVEQVQTSRIIEAPKQINLTFFSGQEIISGGQTGLQNILTGSSYLFLSCAPGESGFVYKNSADALINYLSGVDVITPSSKFNYGNASVEIRNGEENQRPLSLFNKTYIDQQYSQVLRGPYKKNAPISTIPRTDKDASFVDTKFVTGTGSIASQGLISQSLVDTLVNYDYIASASGHTALFTPRVTKESDNILNNIGAFKFLSWDVSSDGKYYNVKFRIADKIYNGTMTFQLEIKQNPNEISYFAKDVIFEDLGGGIRRISIFTPSSNSVLINNTNKVGNFVYYGKALRAAIEILKNGDGSEDTRKISNGVSFSDWNKDYVALIDEKAVPVIHVVNNPNVNQVYVTIGVRALKDTAEKKLSLLSNNPNGKGVKATVIEPGNPFPSLVRFKIETGYQDKFGNQSIYWEASYQIKGYVESQATIDIGREENANLDGVSGKSLLDKYNRFILGTKTIASPINLPEAQAGQIRFVKITRLTAESYSSLVRREISVEKISEIINVPFSYPFSAICGLKLDARSLSEIPSRSYDARFKKVFVPSNYFPLKPNGKDKRYILPTELAAFNALPSNSLDRLVYQGNWDGTFKLAWTDNPVWVLFDLLINRRYGLGNFISPDQVNYWELYKIGRFCDAVDSDGKFVGVPAADGGLEPRYGFNGVIADKTNVFEALKSIVSAFRGNMFYSNSEINFTNDRLKPIMAFFNNANVKDGIFNYNNDRRDLKYNVIEVSFLDRDDLYKEKIEYVEDPDDIKVRGILRTSAQTFGVTSRAHAKRIGEHILYSTINEDQNVAFVASNEILLCRPGDLISVNDEIKTLKRHVGRVIDIDTGNYTLTTNISLSSSDFSSSGLIPEISVLIPTGKYQSSDFYNLAKSASGLNIADVYQTDIPVTVTFPATGTGLLDSPSAIPYGSVFYINQTSSGIPLFNQIKIGTPCSITVANIQQDIYKIQSIKELNLNEYEIIASKFDTGKFAEIEASETLDDYFQFYNSDRTTQVNEGFGYNTYAANQYQLTGILQFQSFTTGQFTGNSAFDFSGSWSAVLDADSYKAQLFRNLDNVYEQTVTGTNIIIDGGIVLASGKSPKSKNIPKVEIIAQSGRQYTLKVQPIKSNIQPNSIGITQSTGFYVGQQLVASNGIFIDITQNR